MFVKIRSATSDQLRVTSGVPPRFSFGASSINFLKDLVNDMECPMLLFVDDAKLFMSINTTEDIQVLKRDMIRLEIWNQKWLLNV